MLSRDVVRSLKIVWMGLSVVILLILTAPFLVGRERLSELTPVCERKARYGLECPFCGMTTSFVNISEGRFGAARKANRAGMPLFLTFVSNEIFALAFLRRKRGTACKY